MKKRNRLFAILLALAMVVTYMPGLAYATEAQPADEPSVEESAGGAEEATEAPQEEAGEVSGQEESGEEAAEAIPAEASEAAPEAEPQAEPEEEPAPEAEPALEAESSEDENAAPGRSIKIAPISKEAETFTPDIKGTEDLLQEYVDKKVAEELRGSGGKSYSKVAGARLYGENLVLYKIFVPLVTKVADGESDSAKFTIPVSDIFGEEQASKHYTAKELNVSDLFEPRLDEDGQPVLDEDDQPIYDISSWAVENFSNYYYFELDAVLNAMMADMPYEMYWFDKTIGVSIDYPEITCEMGDDEEYYLAFAEDAAFEFSFAVSGDYAADAYIDDEGHHRGTTGETDLNTDLTSLAHNAAGNIADTIQANSKKSDYGKLVAYKDAIIGIVDYNDEAAEDSATIYGDPWQLIFVFDKDPATNVVCEGYAKAFQYLCDKTAFKSPKIDCYTVTGSMSSNTDVDGAGPHMWNILHMEDGRNYIADITCSDEDSVGYIGNNVDEDGSYLFLNGFASGDLYAGYTYKCGDDEGDPEVLYVYDGTPGPQSEDDEDDEDYDYDPDLGDGEGGESGSGDDGGEYFEEDEEEGSDMLRIYSEAQLRMSKSAYGEPTEEPVEQEETYYLEEDKDILYGDKLHINPMGFVEYTTGENESDFDVYRVTNIEIVEENIDDENDDAVLEDVTEDESHGNGWDFEAVGYGSATLKITYQKLNGEAASYTIDVNVNSEVFEVILDDHGVNTALPGEPITLTAKGIRKIASEGDSEDYDLDPDMLRWSLDGDGSVYADLEVKDGGETAVVTFKNLPESVSEADFWRGIKVDVGLYAGNSQLASNFEILQMRSDFYEVEPAEIPEPYLYVPEDVTFGVTHKYLQNGKEYSEQVNVDKWTWDYDDELISIEETEDADTFTLTRLGNRDGNLKLNAEWVENGETKSLQDPKEYWLKDWNSKRIWVYRDEDSKIFTDKPATFDVEIDEFPDNWQDIYRLVAIAGIWTESDTDEEEGFIGNTYSSEVDNSGVELEIDEDGMNATVTVSKAVLEEFKEEKLTVRVEMKPKNTEYAQKTAAFDYDDAYVNEPIEDYNTLPDREETWLVGEDRNIDRVGSVWRQNSFEDEEYYFVIEDAEVDNADVLSVVKEPFEGESTDSGNYQWIVRALKKGEATVTLTGSYIEYDSNGNEINSDQGEFSYTFTITVVNDIYSVDIDSVDGRFRALPGDSIELTTNFDHRSTGDIENDNISYTWSFEGGEEFAEFVDADGTVTEPEGENAIVRFKELPEGTDGIDESVIVKVVANNNNVAVADNTCDLNVSSSYVEMQPLRLTEEQANTPVDGEFEFRPVLKRFDMENTEGVIVPISYISFEEDNDDAISSTRDYDDEGYVFRIKRLSEEDASFVIGAYYGTGGEEEYDYIWQRYRFNPIENKEISFVYNNNYLFNDEYKDLSVDTSDLEDGWENKYAIVYKAGIWDDDAESFTKQFGSYCLELDDEDPAVVTLNGGKIWDEFEDNAYDREFLVIAELWEKDDAGVLIGDGPVCDTSEYFYSMESEIAFNLSDTRLLPGDDFTINKLENGSVRDADYPDWGDADFEVLSVGIGTQSPDEEGQNVISITDPDEYEQYWRIKAENCGYAEVTVSYLDHKGRDSNGKTSEELEEGENLVPYTCTAGVFVQDKLYEADIINLSGDDRALPGDVLSLEANARIRSVEQPDSSEGLTYSWAITDKNGYAYFVDEDGDRIDNPEGKEVSLKFGDFPDDYEGGALQTDVMLTVYDEGTEAFTTTRRFYLEDRIETLVWDGFDSDMDVGDVDETTLSVINREIGEEDTPIETNFVVTSDNDGIMVENTGDGNYTLVRKDGSENWIHVYAEFEGENGSQTEMEREFYLPEKNYGVWLEGEEDLSVRDDDEDKALEMHLAGFEKLIEEGEMDADSFDVSVVAAKVPRDEEGNEIEVMPSEEDIVTLDPEIIKSKTIDAENNKLIVTLDGTKIPHEVGEGENAFEVERISLNVTAARSADTEIFDEGKVALYEDEGIGRPIFVTWTCKTLGHDWSEPTYDWADDYSSVTAAHICLREIEPNIEYETVETTSVSEGASCTVPGTITYTATFTKEGFETQTMQVEGGTLPHEWDEASYEWAEGNGSVTASHVCAVCGTEDSETVETISDVTGTPDCEHGTVTTYTAAFTKPGFETQTKDVENDDALGHDWGEPEYTWADDNSSVTATIACGRDSTHDKTETVGTTSEQTLDPTCEEMGETTYTASFESDLFTTQTKTVTNIDALDHEWGEITYSPTETEFDPDVNKTVTASRACTREGCDGTVTETVTITTESDAASCTDPGTVTYTATFTKPEFSEAEWETEREVGAVGHSWGIPTYTWAEDHSTATATAICSRCQDETSETVNTTAEQTSDPTCEEMGETTYTATFTDPLFTTQTATVADIKALGHYWEFKSLTWSGNDKDGYTAVANYECKRDSEHKDSVNAAITEEETVKATCEAAGKTTYTATVAASASLDNAAHEDTREVTVPALGHKWEFVDFTWSGNDKDGYTAVANYKCSNDANHKKTVNAVVDGGIVQTPASCETTGVKVYTATIDATASLDDQAHSGTKNVDTAALGHDWEFDKFTWSGNDKDGYTAVANYKCKRDIGHKDSVDATVEAETVNATCEAAGKTTYTATVAASASLDNAAQEDTKEVTLPALGHKWEFKGFTLNGDVEHGFTAVANYECKNNASHTDTVTAIVNGGVVQKEAKCEQEGVKVFTVTVNASSSLDGEAHEGTENASIPAIGHLWDDGKITTRATDTADGQMAYKCTRQGCNGTKNEKIPAHASPVSAINRNISDAETAIEAGKIADAEAKANAVKASADAAVVQARTAFNNAKASGNAETISAARQDLIDATAAQSRAEATVARAEAKKAAADAEAKKAAAASAAAGTQAAVDAAQAAVTAANTAKEKATAAKAAADRAVENAAPTADSSVIGAAANAQSAAKADVTTAETAVTNANTALNNAKQAKQAADNKKAEEAAKPAKPATKPEVVDLKAVKSLKLKGAKGKITVKWKKATKKELKTFQSYEIQYTLDGTFKDYQPKTVGKKKATVTLKKLLKKKKYTVRIRRIRDDGSVLHVSPWKQKRAKTK